MWKEDVLKTNHGYSFADSILTKENINQTDYMKVNEREGGTDFFSRSKMPGTVSFFDEKTLDMHLKGIFKGIKPEIIADVGCGDGRFTSWVLNNTSAKIIAIDGSFDSLQRLKRNYLDNHSALEERVLLIQTNVMDMPIASEACDLVWSYEVLCYLLDDTEKGIEESLRILKLDGHFILGERTKEFGLLHEFLNRGPKGIIDTHASSQITEDWNESTCRARVFTDEELENVFKKNNVSVVKKASVSSLPLIATYLRSKEIFRDEIEEKADDLAGVFVQSSQLRDSMARSRIFVTVKKKRC